MIRFFFEHCKNIITKINDRIHYISYYNPQTKEEDTLNMYKWLELEDSWTLQVIKQCNDNNWEITQFPNNENNVFILRQKK